MPDHRLLAIIIVLVIPAFAGCISAGDDAPEPDTEDPTEAVVTDDTGSVKGEIVTLDLQEVAGAEVGLYDSDSQVASARTNELGVFVLNDLSPGSYRLRVADACCHHAVESVEVQAGKVTELNLQLKVLTAEDLNEPYTADKEWHGFIACGARGGVPGVVAPGIALCTAAEDPNDDFIHYFKMRRGVTSVVIGMDWDPGASVSGHKLSLSFEEGICEEVACSDAYTYAQADGDPPFVIRVDREDITNETARWENIEDEAEFKFRVFAGTDYANLVYQQPFSVYWHEFYNDKQVPEGFTPIPDH